MGHLWLISHYLTQGFSALTARENHLGNFSNAQYPSSTPDQLDQGLWGGDPRGSIFNVSQVITRGPV